MISYLYFTLLSINASIGSFLRGIINSGFLFTMLTVLILTKSNSFKILSLSVLHFCAIFGVFLSCEIADRYGRIRCFFVSSVLYFISGVVCSLGYIYDNEMMMLIGTVISGLTQGLNAYIVPVYSKL